MADWQREITELHQVFETYFLGTTNSLERVDAVLDPSFTMVGPTGITSSRAATMSALEAGHGHSSALRITVTDMQLLMEDDATIVASYVENHELADRSNHRLSTVVFTLTDRAVGKLAPPNGLLWRRVHETWLT